MLEGRREAIVQSRLNPYLSFRDKARDAMEFYYTVFGGKLELRSFKEYNASQDPSEDKKIMHSVLEFGEGQIFYAADTPNRMEYKGGANISMSLMGDNEDQLKAWWQKLSAGATIHQKLEKAPWGDTFGMLTDKFGVAWMVNITAKKA
jgi:PhnB protein